MPSEPMPTKAQKDLLADIGKFRHGADVFGDEYRRVASLEKHGWLEDTGRRNGRRRVMVITPAGRAALQRFEAKHGEVA